MKLSDFISLFSILIAIFAFINEKERKFVLNKFNIYNYIIIIFYLILINFLFFYKWWSNTFPSLHFFEFPNFPKPETWVYISSIFIIIWFIYKIFFASFPSSNLNKIIHYYQYLINRKDYHSLYSYIYKFNKTELFNNNDEFVRELINKFLSNYHFLQATSLYNFTFINKLIEKHTFNKFLVINFIKTQISTNSYLFNNHISKNELIQFYKLIEKEQVQFNKSVNNYFSNTYNFEIINFTIDFYIFLYKKSKNINFICLTDIFNSILRLNKHHSIDIYFNTIYNKLNEIQKETIIFEELIDFITNNQLDVFNKSYNENYLIDFIEKYRILYNNSNKKILKNKLENTFNKDVSNKFRIKFYNLLKTSDKDEFYTDFIKIASNY